MPETVLIIGAGFAGRTAHRVLRDHFNVILVDLKECFEYIPSTLRCMVQPDNIPSVVMEHHVPVRVDAVSALAPQVSSVCNERDGDSVVASRAILKSGDLVTFDYCIICTGSSYSLPIKASVQHTVSMEDRRSELCQASARVKAADRIVIIGGGTVGVELAAEVAGTFGSRKEVTLIASHSRLLPALKASAGEYAARWLAAHGVKLLLNQRVVAETPLRDTAAVAVVKTQTGREVEADAVFWCIGSRPNGGHLVAQDWIGSVAMDASLRVKGYANVFAAGDCTAGDLDKTAFVADLAAQVAAQNVVRLSSGQSLAGFPQSACFGASSVPVVECVSLFKYDGIMQLKGVVVSGWVAAISKRVIEQMQLGLAREIWMVATLWRAMEVLMLLICLILPS